MAITPKFRLKDLSAPAKKHSSRLDGFGHPGIHLVKDTNNQNPRLRYFQI